MEQNVTVRKLIKYAGYELQIDVVAGVDGLDQQIKTAESNRPGRRNTADCQLRTP